MISSRRRKRNRFASVTLTGAALTVLPVLGNAAPISIANASFENPLTGSFVNTIDDWSYDPTATLGVFRPGTPPPNPYFNTAVPDGDQIGYINTNTAIAQQLTATLQNGSYDLSAYFGNRKDENLAAQGFLELYAGGTVSNGNVTGGALLGSVAVDESLITPGTFVQSSFTYTASASDLFFYGGQNLSVRIVKTGPPTNSQLDVDLVQLNVTAVPEVSTILHFSCLVTAGGLGLLRLRRKSK